MRLSDLNTMPEANTMIIAGAMIEGDSTWLRANYHALHVEGERMLANGLETFELVDEFRCIGRALHATAAAIVALGYPDPRPSV